jgi:WD40 repeat protein
VLLTLSAATALHAQSNLKAVASHDPKIVRRWSLAGDPHGIALGNDGTVYVGLAQPQAVMAIDPNSGAIKQRVILDSAEIAATKELVTLRMNADRTRLYVANGSDESASILTVPDLHVTREITIEGEPIRDALPDPAGRYLFLLGRRIHIYDANGKNELRTLGFDDPSAIAVTSGGSRLAVIGNNRLSLYDTNTFEELSRERLENLKAAEGTLFAAGDRVLIILGRDVLIEKPLASARKTINEPICLPEGSGPQIASLASPELLLFAERRCSGSVAFGGTDRVVAPASLHGVDAYAVAYDRQSNFLYTTERAGYLTIYRVPHAAVAH